MKRLVFALVVGVGYFSALAISGLEAGGGGGGGGGCYEPLSKGSGSRVEISSSCFKTTVLNVDRGAHVEWVNNDPYQHNVVFAGVDWSDWRPLQQRQTISYAFVSEGVFPYFCAFHPSMVGAVVVGDGVSAQIAGDAAQPAPAANSFKETPLARETSHVEKSDGIPADAVAGIALVVGIVAAGGSAALTRRRDR